MSDNIKVVVKVRPLISREIEDNLSYQWHIKNNTIYQIDQNGKVFGSSYTFDQIYDKETKTDEVYNDVAKPIVEAAIAGINGTIFAYGQTSSGKTYTMTGTKESPGIIPLTVHNLFEIIKAIPNRDFLVRVSYIEIYNEMLKDLLDIENKKIKIHETLQGVKVDVTEKVTACPEEMLKKLKEGEENRHTGTTNMNEESSRSHTIFQITIESREHAEGEETPGCVNVSVLNLVDLAGSERAGQTGATGLRFKEGTLINKSLSALALVIKQLSEDPNKFTNYRDSKLTRILQNSLGGNAKTSIICAVTPAAIEETISTLQFANRAKAIKNKPEINAVATDKTMIQSLTKQLSKLQSQLESKKAVEQDNQQLQNQIASLKRVILNSFVQRSSADIINPRRRNFAPRRVTISTLHSIDEDDVPTVPKFCTPILKYNPLSFPSTSDFVPIQNANRLDTLSEEARLITPPPRDNKTVCEEIIDLVSSKTPPCILRKNAKIAEKNLKDIEELTEREKLYTPDVNELIEKLQESLTAIDRLNECVNKLNQESKEKDIEIDKLKTKISTCEKDTQSLSSVKLELEAKIIDWEVSYDTLKQKTKRREEELLSLIDDKNKKSEDIGKPARPFDKELVNFMDMSKDISLVNSDNECSVIHTNDDVSSSQIQDLVTEMQAQLTCKSQIIQELESNLCTQNKKLKILEETCSELEKMITSLKDNVSETGHENSLLKATIDTLNSTINNQKTNLETAHKEMDSYNSMIKELQNQLNDKENVDININDRVLENMIVNEEKFISNNENMTNIIQSFKLALQSRKEEIDLLKSAQFKNIVSAQDDEELKQQLNSKDAQIATLNEDTRRLNAQLHEKQTLIDELVSQKDHLTNIQYQLTEKFNNVEEAQKKIENQYIETMELVETLKIANEQLTLKHSETNIREKELMSINDNLQRQIEKLTKNIEGLEQDINAKDTLFVELKKGQEESQDNLITAKSSANKLQNILLKLTGNIQEIPEIIDNFAIIFNSFNVSLNILDDRVCEMVSEKEQYRKVNDGLRMELSTLSAKHETEIAALYSQIQSLSDIEKELTTRKDDLQQQLNESLQKLQSTCEELRTKGIQNIDLEDKLRNSIITNEDLQNELLSKDSLIKSLKLDIDKQDKKQIEDEVNNLKEYYKNEQACFEEILCGKDSEIFNLKTDVKSMMTIVEEKEIEISEYARELNIMNTTKDQIMTSILKKVIDLSAVLNIDLSRDFETNVNNIHDQVNLILDEITNYITKTNVCGNACKPILDLFPEITELTEQNSELGICCIDTKDQELFKIEITETEKNNFKNILIQANLLLKTLKDDIKEKSNEIDVMKSKILEWQKVNMSLNQETELLQMENTQSLRSNSEEDESNAFNESKSFYRSPTKTLPTNIPRSLISICCDKMLEYIQPRETSSTSSSNTSDIPVNDETPYSNCNCERLSLDLVTAHELNSQLMETIEELESVNRQLVNEKNCISQEVQLLLETAYELQKKTINHRTNLSTLTATTYAENRLLKSQVKALQHHHTRFHMVCQRDLPAVKRQLAELMSILKNDSLYSQKLNASFKRFSLPDMLENTSMLSNLKNEDITLDGDLLIDTNFTLTTSADNTLIGADQTCLDITQSYLDAACQTLDITNISNLEASSQIDALSQEYQKVLQNLETLKVENLILRDQMDIYCNKNAQTSPVKVDINATNPDTAPNICNTCQKYKIEITDILLREEKLNKTVKTLSEELSEVKTQKEDLYKKYENLSLEIPSTDSLIRKLNTMEKERDSVAEKLALTINKKNQEIKTLLEENDSLSTQIMENVTEVDDLNSKLQSLLETNTKLNEKCSQLEMALDQKETTENNTVCPECNIKIGMTRSLCVDDVARAHSKLNRSMSESDTSSRFNKICTLQNELHAGKEECIELTEDVTTIKKHLERNNMSLGQDMDLDGSMIESNIYTFTKECDIDPPLNKVIMSDIPEEPAIDIYTLDKIDCINFYLEITGAEKDSCNRDTKIIEVMKMFYHNLLEKHYEEQKKQIEFHLNNLNSEYQKMTDEIKDKDKKLDSISKVIILMKNNLNAFMTDFSTSTEFENNDTAILIFKEKLLSVLDSEFGFSSVSVFENLVANILNKHDNDLSEIIGQNVKLEQQVRRVIEELNVANENITQMKCQLTDKENEYNLLKAQKERVHEISNAVTLDIIKKEREFSETVAKGCQKLVEHNIFSPNDIDWNLPINKNVNVIFERFISEIAKRNLESENENLLRELQQLKLTLESKEKTLEAFKQQQEHLQGINKNMSIQLHQKEDLISKQESIHNDLIKIYDAKVEENQTNINLIGKMSEEISLLKSDIAKKQSAIDTLENESKTYKQSEVETSSRITELMNKIAVLEREINDLKVVNEILNNEKESRALDVNKSEERIKQNKMELERMTSDILVLRESVKENVTVIENLKVEAQTLLQQNMQLKQQFEEKCRDCSRLEMNIKTHEKTAEIQSQMIIRLQKQKDVEVCEKGKTVERLTQLLNGLQMEFDTVNNNLKSSKEEIEELKTIKQTLELRLSELEAESKVQKPRTSTEPNADSSRRRRQSIHDSQRVFNDSIQDSGDNSKIEAVFGSVPKTDDVYLDAEGDSSNRSTPLRLSKGRDSLLSRGENDEDPPSRPSSVQAIRRRRQSSHDLRRSQVRQSPEPHDISRRLLDESSVKLGKTGDASDIENVKRELESCRQELEELRERYKELDDECETCSQYLREQEDQCRKLKKEKVGLENIIADLREKIQTSNPNSREQNAKPIYSDASVNTDEDWTNLHSVVVDRMSFDAEVEKTKRLTKTIEELRFKNQDLRGTLAKMQKQLERNSGADSRGSEAIKAELQTCKQELEELREKYKELDDECEMCSQYLREKEELCRNLKKEKACLEAKLKEFQEDNSPCVLQSRKRRQTLHDQNRSNVMVVNDATTETSDDFLSYQVERDETETSKQPDDRSRELKRLKMAVEKLTQQRTNLEQQLMAMSAHPMYIATGSAIVQNQQLTDVMKENQKLKKINAKLITICKKRGKETNTDRENEDPS